MKQSVGPLQAQAPVWLHGSMPEKRVLVGVLGLRTLRLGWAWKVLELERKPVCLEGRGHERWSERCVYREDGSAGFGT